VNIVLWVKNSLEKGEKIQVINDQWRTPTLAEDLAAGCMVIAQKMAEGIFNLSGKDLLTPYEMALKTAQFFNLDPSLIEEVDGSVFTQLAQRPARTGLILDKAIAELNYKPNSFDDSMFFLQKQLLFRSF
jgi:dTDP-4-dehydrorhamnose reductase